jgi:hypothetical protein
VSLSRPTETVLPLAGTPVEFGHNMPDMITVTVDDDHVARIQEIADQLRAAGMQIGQVLPEIGVITGAAMTSVKPAISALPGVAAVTYERSFQLPPPDSDIQ